MNRSDPSKLRDMPAPDLWPRIRDGIGGEPSPKQRRHSGPGRGAIILVSLVVFGLVVGLLIRALPSDSRSMSPTTRQHLTTAQKLAEEQRRIAAEQRRLSATPEPSPSGSKTDLLPLPSEE